MKIIHCIGKLKGGGAETQLRIFKQNYQNKKLNNIIITLNGEGMGLYRDKHEIYNLMAVPVSKRWYEIYKILKKEKPDLIHIWLPAISPYFLFPALLYHKSKVILGIRSVYKVDSTKKLLHFLLYHLSNNYISNVHPEDITGLYKKLSSRKFYYVPNGIDVSIPTYSSKESEPGRLLFIGRFIEEKNVSLLIKALEKLQKIGKNFRLDICGSGPLEENLKEEISEKNLNPCIKIHDFQDDLIPFYQKAAALILPSWREGMPNVAFEAAKFGKVLILSDIPQHKRWFKDGYNAILFKSNNLDSLCKAIDRFLEMPESERIKMSNINKDVIKDLSIDNYCKKLEKTYEKILEN